jgi:SM-20-related protein
MSAPRYPARAVRLEHFLYPEELWALQRHALDHRDAFRMGRVIRRGERAGRVVGEQRSTRVLVDAGAAGAVVGERVLALVPHLQERFGMPAWEPGRVEVQLSASRPGDFFRVHSDNGHPRFGSRAITFVLFFHLLPQRFGGGVLRLYDSVWREGRFHADGGAGLAFAPEQNLAVCFPSYLVHEVTPVRGRADGFAGSRLAVNGWIHRAA